MEFVDQIAARHGVPLDHLLVQYLRKKTQAVDRGSKARRSLGNLYALFVLAEDFIADRTSRFTDLLARMKALPFGAKLQNHPLDNRLNDEFARQMGVTGSLLPVLATRIDGKKGRVISIELLAHSATPSKATAAFVVDAVSAYVRLIALKQDAVLKEIEDIENLDGFEKIFEEAFAPESDARLFEIVSFVILAEHFRRQSVWIGQARHEVHQERLALFRAGRTNANDGGIDFVLKPLGRIFQVTETLDFRKYFLDFEKVNRYPISFVIKTEKKAESVMSDIRSGAEKSGEYEAKRLDQYMDLFEEVITLDGLRAIAKEIPESALGRMREQLLVQFQLEYGLLD